MQIFHHATTVYNQCNQFLNIFFRKNSLKIQHRYSIMTAKHIYGIDFFLYQFFRPCCQILATFIFNGIDHKPGQKEIIGHITFFCYRLINMLLICGMDFRQQRQLIRFCIHSDLFQQIPCFRFIQKIFPTRSLWGIGKSIQPHNTCAIGSDFCKCFPIKIPYLR